MDKKLTAILQVLKRAIPLKELPRIGWIFEGAARSETDSVAAHSHLVTLISLLVVKQVGNKFGPISLERVLAMATLHDLSECVTGDLESGFKRRLESKPDQKRLLDQLEQEAFADLVGDISTPNELTELFQEYSDLKTKESKIVKFADVLEAFAHGHDRIGKIYPAYLNHSRAALERDGPELDGGLGKYLSTWIGEVIDGWSTT